MLRAALVIGTAYYGIRVEGERISSGPSSILSSASCSLPSDCIADHCSTACCPDRSADPYCPNCHGANFTCLATSTQEGLGQDPAFGGTFNDFGYKGNTGFCKYQAPAAGSGLVNKSSMGPRALSSGRVFAGVGLSQAQFGDMLGNALMDGAVACGMCLEVSAKQALWDCDLTQPSNRYEPETWPDQTVILMVADQCRDYWDSWSDDGTTPTGNCATGHLDYDVYPSDGDVSWLGIQNLTWRAVECPVDGLPIQFAFSSTTNSQYYLSVHLWDARVPVDRVEIEAECSNGTKFWVDTEFSSNGWFYQGQSHCLDLVAGWPTNVNFRVTSVLGETIQEAVSVPIDTWTQVEGWIAWPPLNATTNFERSEYSQSTKANAHYRHCVKY